MGMRQGGFFGPKMPKYTIRFKEGPSRSDLKFGESESKAPHKHGFKQSQRNAKKKGKR